LDKKKNEEFFLQNRGGERGKAGEEKE